MNIPMLKKNLCVISAVLVPILVVVVTSSDPQDRASATSECSDAISAIWSGGVEASWLGGDVALGLGRSDRD